MPSILSKFRRRKGSSSSSSTPPSPSSPTFRDSRRSVDAAPHDNTRFSNTLPDQDPVVIPRSTRPNSVGNGPDIVDEADRPNLPTTSSNVHNPAPDPSRLSWQQDNVHSQQEKALPVLPELSPGLHDSAFPHPLPHVTEVDRSNVLEQSRHRPDMVGSGDDEQELGREKRFRQSEQARSGTSAREAETRQVARTNIPTQAIAQASSTRRDATTAPAPLVSQDNLRSTWDPEVTPEQHISRHFQQLSIAPKQTEHLPIVDSAALRAERMDMVEKIALAARARKAEQSGLTDAGKKAFRAAGLDDKLDQRGSVDVHTRWIEPVVQEYVRRLEHTEYTTIINKEIHKYHIYPKIQPISDPDPIVLEARHRIFSEVDGQWHEVIGDDAAIAILGKDVFLNGKKDVRHVRGKALPGFGEVAEMTDKDRATHGLAMGMGRVLEREGLLGHKLGEWHEVARYGSSASKAGVGHRAGETGLEERTMGLAI